MILYITGSIGAGKGEAVKYLCEQYGFEHYSFRKFFSHEIATRGLPNDRPHMIDLADEIRQKNGTSYVVRTLTEQARASGRNAVIESIRNLGEVEYIQAQPDAILLGIDAPVAIRFERNKLRATTLDPQSFEDFIRDEKREMENVEPWRNNIAQCLKLADHVYENKGTREELHAWIDQVLSEKVKLT